MPGPVSSAHRAAAQEMARAKKLVNEGNPAEGRDILLAVRAQARREGTSSAFASWGLAIAYDHLDDPQNAVASILEAIEQEPLCPAFRRTFDGIVSRVRGTICADGCEPDDSAIPVLYRLLLPINQADTACHLMMARYLDAVGMPHGALRIVDALLVLAPELEQLVALHRELVALLGPGALAELGPLQRGPKRRPLLPTQPEAAA